MSRKPVDDDDLVFLTLDGLGPEYTVASIIANKSVSLEFVDLQGILTDHKRRLESEQSIHTLLLPTANVATSTQLQNRATVTENLDTARFAVKRDTLL